MRRPPGHGRCAVLKPVLAPERIWVLAALAPVPCGGEVAVPAVPVIVPLKSEPLPTAGRVRVKALFSW